MRDNILMTLLTVFVPLSLTSVGGGNAILSALQHEAVEVNRWVTQDEFIQLFAISRAAPGPGTMLSTLIGWKAAGWLGAIVATLAFAVPSSLICYVIISLTNTHRERAWHKAVRQGLAPVAVGLTIASSVAVFRLSGATAIVALVIIGSTFVIMRYPKVPVFVVLFMGGAATTLEHLLR